MLIGCSRAKTARTKIVVEVDTPEGKRSGYSIVEEQITPAGMLSISDNRYSSRFQGEAVAVDLPDGRTIFALLHNGHTLDMPNLIGRVLYPQGRKSGDPLRRASEPPLEMPLVARGLQEPGQPMLVTFTNIDDPKTVQRVDPANLAAAFGPGYGPLRITAQATDEPITAGIEKRLKWLPALKGNGLPKKNPTAMAPPFGLQGSYFSTLAHR